MSPKLVTSKQAKYLQQLVNDQKVGRVAFQEILDNGAVVRLINFFKILSRATVQTEVTVIRTHSTQIKVKPHGASAVIDQKIVLVNFPMEGRSLEKACAWANGMGLERADDDQIMAIAEQHPTLYKQLGFTDNRDTDNLMYVAATAVRQENKVCLVSWNLSRDSAGKLDGTVKMEVTTFWPVHLLSPYAWFVFKAPGN